MSTIDDLTTATTALLNAVNVSKATLDAEVTAATTQAGIATTQAGLATTNGAVQVALATVQTGLATVQASTATSQANLAAGYAAAAGSVAQQDLSGCIAAALHRSPNPVTAMTLMDASLDTDGGANTERNQNTTWYNDPLNGGWLTGGFATELAARQVTGATTGSFYQNSADGKFYAINKNLLLNTATLSTQTVYLLAGTYTLSGATASSGSVALSGAATGTFTAPTAMAFTVATSGNVVFTVTGSVTTAQLEPGSSATTYAANTGAHVTETFRGNTAKRPKLAAAVCEAGNCTIYDLTSPGRPMWMRFVGTATNMLSNTLSAIAYVNGVLYFGSSAAYGVIVVNFAKDSVNRYYSNSIYTGTYTNNIANRNTVSGFTPSGTTTYLVNSTVNAIACTVLPDSPVNVQTGLQEPTVAVMTAGGVSVIQHNGNVSSHAFTYVGDSVSAFGNYLVYTNQNSLWAPRFVRFADISGSTFIGTLPAISLDVLSVCRIVAMSRSTGIGLLNNTSNVLQLFRINYSGLASKSLGSRITPTYNTGTLLGDIRRAYLCDIVAGAITAPELCDDVNFASATGWTFGAGWVFTSVGVVTGTAAMGAVYKSSVNTVIGTVYRVTITGNLTSEAVSAWVGGVSGSAYSTPGAFSITQYITATSTAGISVNGRGAGFTGTISSVSYSVALPDRSYKAAGASIVGTLTATPVATGAQLCGLSGWNGANYIREVYSADLDFGTGEFSIPAWVNIPTANSTAGIIVSRADGSGKRITFGITSANYITATAYDGTTTRTVTTSAAYNTGTYIKARAIYTTDGTLSISVNSVIVASTTGVPLLTLNNSSAVLTIGNSYALDAPFPGSICLLKASATVPTVEQAQWSYAKESPMFQAGTNIVLPDSGNIVDMSYDDKTDSYEVVQVNYRSTWQGLVRTAVTPVPAGTYSHVATGANGVKLLSRITTTPGVDVTIPALNLQSELDRRNEGAAKLGTQPITVDYLTGFTGTTSTTATTITSVTGITPAQQHVGMVISDGGTNITAGTVITGFSGTTFYINQVGKASGSANISITDYVLPIGHKTLSVINTGLALRETTDYTRLYDGFKETIRLTASPAYNTYLQITSIKE